MKFDQARWRRDDGPVYEPLLCEKHERSTDVDVDLPESLTREELTLPDPAEPQVARHYTRLSEMTYGVEHGPYPLGSCTMKYNPWFVEDLAASAEAHVHPDRPDGSVQGVLAVLHRLQEQLAEIGGMDAVTLQPPAGAAGEFAGILIARAYHEATGDPRSEVIVPDTAHGTNFASAAMGGYDVVELPSGEDGRVELDALAAALSEETAALMLTNPNTLGLFERDIEEIAAMVHDVGGLLYYDGANLNAMLGRVRPGDMGFDVMHYNVHKTFATPHGGGGPGAGPVGVVDELAPFLPEPRVRRVPAGDGGADGEGASDAGDGGGERVPDAGDADGATEPPGAAEGAEYELFEPERSIGKVHGFCGNWLVLLKAAAYVARLGDEGLTDASAKAVLNANYLASQVHYDVPYGPFHHEFVASAGDRDAAEVAKRMLDHGVHPPTTKWPEIVPEALMTEPTEVESKDSLDQLATAFDAVAAEDDETLADAPRRTAARRIDQATAAREPRLSWQDLDEE